MRHTTLQLIRIEAAAREYRGKKGFRAKSGDKVTVTDSKGHSELLDVQYVLGHGDSLVVGIGKAGFFHALQLAFKTLF